MQIDVSWMREEYNALIRVADGLLDMIRRGQACNVLTFARMAEEARAATDAMRAIQDRKPPPDAEEIRKASEALQWRLRLFDEQRHMVSYVCESPALIEQRLGALARIIAAAME